MKQRLGTLLTSVRDQWLRLRPSRPVRYLLAMLLIAMGLFTLIRLTLLLRNLHLLEQGIDNDTSLVVMQMFNGMRFDLAWLAKVWILPLVVLLIAQYLPRWSRHLAITTIVVMCIPVALSLMIAIGNIPYFEHFNNHLNAMAMKYMLNDMGDAMGMVVGDGSYLCFAIAAIVVAAGFCLIAVRLARRYDIYTPAERRTRTLIAMLIIGAIIPLADRGFIFKKHVLQPADGMVCNNTFINKLAVNPVEPFLRSLLHLGDTSLNLIDSRHAAAYVRSELGRGDDFTEHVEAHTSPWRNVVIILMESTSAERMAMEGDTNGYTPNLDSLAKEGLYYANAYSTGTHTCNAIYSVVTSMPSYVDLHPMQDGSCLSLDSIYEQLHKRGELRTLFFITHQPNFDNVRDFVTTQGFERLISLDDYNSATNHVWGVRDHEMFERTIDELNDLADDGERFAAICLTCTNHVPYLIPDVEGFTPRSSSLDMQALEYADWALGHFMAMASNCSWYDDTLFVIAGDHGSAIGVDYEINESFNHIPLIFYSPKHIMPEVRTDLVSQMDITPTAMSMLGVEYENHTMGIDLTTQSRRMIPYGADGHIAARDQHWIYNYDVYNDIDFLYSLNAEGDDRYINVASKHPDVVSTMYEYVASMVQAGWDMHNNPELIKRQPK